VKILLEMRPALDGYSGIPQETRLLFRGLAATDGYSVQGLLQSGNLVLEAGLPVRNGIIDRRSGATEGIDRLSKVVVSLQQGPASHRLEALRKRFYRYVGPMAAAGWSMLGGKTTLTGFDPAQFKDFVWRSMFAKSLPFEDQNKVTTGEFRIMRWPWSMVNAVGVASASLGHAVYPRMDTSGIDVMIAETPYPGRVSGKTRMVVRYHDAIPLLMPHTIKDRGYHRAAHFHSLQRNAADGAWFACVSDATRDDLLSVLPQVAARTVTIPNMVLSHFAPDGTPASRVPDIVWGRRNRNAPHEGGAAILPEDLDDGRLSYLLMVSTIEPRKNHLALLDAWLRLRAERFPRLNLVIVGSFGWEHQAIVQRFAPWLLRGGLHLLADVPTADLRLLYQHADATVCPSFGEGFDFAGIEAMRCAGVVAASDIRVHRDIYEGAADYFSAYSVDDIVRVVGDLIAPGAADRRAALREAGVRVSDRYLPEQVMPQWRDFLQHVVA